jgi:hypothetical protein
VKCDPLAPDHPASLEVNRKAAMKILVGLWVMAAAVIAPGIVAGAQERAKQQHLVCYGEYEPQCRAKFPGVEWQGCDVSTAAKDVCRRYCGKPVGRGSCTVERRPGTTIEPGDGCGYSWFDVRCY